VRPYPGSISRCVCMHRVGICHEVFLPWWSLPIPSPFRISAFGWRSRKDGCKRSRNGDLPLQQTWPRQQGRSSLFSVSLAKHSGNSLILIIYLSPSPSHACSYRHRSLWWDWQSDLCGQWEDPFKDSRGLDRRGETSVRLPSMLLSFESSCKILKWMDWQTRSFDLDFPMVSFPAESICRSTGILLNPH